MDKQQGAKEYHGEKERVSLLLNSCKDGHLVELKRLLANSNCKKEMLTTTKDAHGRCGLHFASLMGRTKVMEYLLSEMDEFVVDENGCSPLFYAVRENRLSSLKLLVNAGYNVVNDVSKDGTSLIIEAATLGYLEIVEYLIQLKCDVNQLGKDGTALHAAIGNDHVKIVDLLVNTYKADVNVKSKLGLSPLLLATICKRKDAILILLSTKMISLLDEFQDGLTVVHVAAETGCLDVLKLFYEYNREDFTSAANFKTNALATPYDLALDMEHRDVVDYLTECTDLSLRAENRKQFKVPEETVRKDMTKDEQRSEEHRIQMPKPPSVPVCEEEKKKAMQWKEEGNQLFHAKKYQDAISSYSKSIEIDRMEAIYYSNRCAAYLALQQYSLAYHDILIADQLRPHWKKAIFRKAECLQGLKKFEDAANVYWELLKHNSKDAALQAKFQKCIQLGREQHLANNT